MYCKSEIEGQKRCSVQCEHCNIYYKPIQAEQSIDISKFPWIAWFRIEIRKDWFCFFFKTRGSNFLEFQIWIFKISIGMPWKKHVLEYWYQHNKLMKHQIKTNQNMYYSPMITFQIGEYKYV
jgi:hypothetical protein